MMAFKGGFMGSAIEMILTVIALSFWILFPIGMFISVSHVDNNTDQIVRLDHLKHLDETPEEKSRPLPEYQPVPFDWHHPILYFRRWLQHE